jgi:hypothetical protein
VFEWTTNCQTVQLDFLWFFVWFFALVFTGEEKDPIHGSGKELVVARELDACAGLHLELRDGDATLRMS